MKTGRHSAEYCGWHINRHKIWLSLLLITTFQPWENLWGRRASLVLFHRLGTWVRRIFQGSHKKIAQTEPQILQLLIPYYSLHHGNDPSTSKSVVLIHNTRSPPEVVSLFRGNVPFLRKAAADGGAELRALAAQVPCHHMSLCVTTRPAGRRAHLWQHPLCPAARGPGHLLSTSSRNQGWIHVGGLSLRTQTLSGYCVIIFPQMTTLKSQRVV